MNELKTCHLFAPDDSRYSHPESITQVIDMDEMRALSYLKYIFCQGDYEEPHYIAEKALSRICQYLIKGGHPHIKINPHLWLSIIWEFFIHCLKKSENDKLVLLIATCLNIHSFANEVEISNIMALVLKLFQQLPLLEMWTIHHTSVLKATFLEALRMENNEKISEVYDVLFPALEEEEVVHGKTY